MAIDDDNVNATNVGRRNNDLGDRVLCSLPEFQS